MYVLLYCEVCYMIVCEKGGLQLGCVEETVSFAEKWDSFALARLREQFRSLGSSKGGVSRILGGPPSPALRCEVLMHCR